MKDEMITTIHGSNGSKIIFRTTPHKKLRYSYVPSAKYKTQIQKLSTTASEKREAVKAWLDANITSYDITSYRQMVQHRSKSADNLINQIWKNYAAGPDVPARPEQFANINPESRKSARIMIQKLFQSIK